MIELSERVVITCRQIGPSVSNWSCSVEIGLDLKLVRLWKTLGMAKLPFSSPRGNPAQMRQAPHHTATLGRSRKRAAKPHASMSIFLRREFDCYVLGPPISLAVGNASWSASAMFSGSVQ